MTVYSGECGLNATWTFDDSTGLLHISGTGLMEDYRSDTEQPWYEYQPSVTKIKIDSGINSIGDFAFEDGWDGWSMSIDRIVIPDTVHTIGKRAFDSMDYVSEVVIGSSVSKIKEYAFAGVGSELEHVEAIFKGDQPTLGNYSFDLRTTATIYSNGWASDEVFFTSDDFWEDTPASSATKLTYELYVPGPHPSVKVGDTWRESTPYVKVGGTWREVTGIYTKVNGVWKETN